MKSVIAASALLFCSSSYAVNYEDCGDNKVKQVIAGPMYGSMVRLDNESCGKSGWVCIEPQNEADELISNRVFSIALAAQASGKDVFVRWRNDGAYGCNGAFPLVHDFRITN